MICMEQIKASDVVKIIEACSKSGVVELKLADLEIKFGPHYQTYQKVEYAVDEFSEPQALDPKDSPQNKTDQAVDEDFYLFNDPVAWDNRIRSPEGDQE